MNCVTHCKTVFLAVQTIQLIHCQLQFGRQVLPKVKWILSHSENYILGSTYSTVKYNENYSLGIQPLPKVKWILWHSEKLYFLQWYIGSFLVCIFVFNQFIYNLLWVYWGQTTYQRVYKYFLSACQKRGKKSKSWLSACCVFFTLSIHVSNQAGIQCFDKLRVWVKKE